MPTLLPTRTRFTGSNPTDVGTIAHVLVATHVPLVDGDGVPNGVLDRMYAVAYALIDANPNRTRVVATEAASLAYRYLTAYLPAAPWRLLGVEFDTGAGRVDVAWHNDQTGEVFFDEVKTSRVTSGRRIPETWVDQARRYAAAGTTEFGTQFRGTRLLPLMVMGTARLVQHRQPVIGLSPTATEPLRIKRDQS